MAQYSDKIMQNRLEECSAEELASVLVTCDGRGPHWKQKALDILLGKMYDTGFQHGGRFAENLGPPKLSEL
jgi:hypothetical protein